MAIYMFSGKTGSGKTANAVKLVHKFWKQGQDIWSNTPLFFTQFNNGFGGQNIMENPEYFHILTKIVWFIKYRVAKIIAKLRKKELTIHCPTRGRINYFDTIDETFHVKEAVILFDEGQTLFRNYDWESIPRLFLHKIEQNRKHEINLVTTAQRVKAVNINYRELIQFWTHFETILSSRLFKFHLYRKKIKDIDFISEQMQEQDIPTQKSKWGLLGWWQKRIYDTMFDIGFEPLQHYRIMLGQQVVRLHLESGMSVKQAITTINAYKRLLEI